MSQKSTIQLIDDIDGTEAAETVSFALDGKTYEIDLTSEHASEFRDTMGAYTAKARTVSGRTRRGAAKSSAKSTEAKSTSTSSTSSTTDSHAVRAWAKEQGMPVADRGRIPQSVISEFENAQKAS